ncbi:MAG: radical SAM protein [Candidatus Heimdallarchaeota archaeon]|nr:radical SAM protein [Candidatus Heimdallarchaeota archaeon]
MSQMSFFRIFKASEWPLDFCRRTRATGEELFNKSNRRRTARTGGDLTCQPEYYVQVTQAIKEKTAGKLWILIETNGYALTRKNLELLKEGGIDSFWLDIKAFNSEVYRKLCGTSNTTVLKALAEMVDLDFTVEILTLYIPGFVETNQHKKIAQLIYEINDEIPTTLLAFFPSYKLSDLRSPNYTEMIKSYQEMKGEGVKNLRLGNIGIFAKTKEQLTEIQKLRK